jgi:hypothetical protein
VVKLEEVDGAEEILHVGVYDELSYDEQATLTTRLGFAP